VKVGDLVRPYRRTGHHMVGVIVKWERATSVQGDYILVHFHRPHITIESKWVREMWFKRTEVEVISEGR